ncbi:MAG: anti-sigma factor family protein, partial [Pirellulaceae bacterium]
MSDFWSEERITDYLDDRLSQPERELVEAHLQENPGDAETLREFQQMREALRGAKTFKLDDGFSQRVLQSIQQLPQPVTVTAPMSPMVERSRESMIKSNGGLQTNWRYTAGMIAAIAATLLLAVFLVPWNRTPVNSAQVSKNEMQAAEENTAGDLEKEPEHAAGGIIPAESADTRDASSSQDTGKSLAQREMEQAKPPSLDSFGNRTSETNENNDPDESE